MGRRNIFLLFLILLIGFLLRIWYLDKPEGLWNDEYVSWFIASKTFSSGFLQELVRNCHMPLYYLYLKLWMFFFSDNDLSLRFSSVFMGALSIISMYFVGKEFRDKNLGLLCAGFTALSGFLIYFSQEVRLYSLLFFITSLCILMNIKLAKEQSKLNFILWGLMNFLILMTHSIGFVFVFVNMVCAGIYLCRLDKKYIKYVVSLIVVVFATLIPFVLFLHKIFTGSYISQFWSSFNWGKVFFTFSDYFSPIQVNLITTPKKVISIFHKGVYLNRVYIVFAMIPALFCFIAVINAFLQKDRLAKYFAAIVFVYLSALVAASYSGKLVFITKYSVEIYPILILFICFGVYSFKKEIVRNIFIAVLVALPLFYYLVNNNSTPKLGRSEGNRIVIELLEAAKIKPTDTVILTYYDVYRFEKYLNNVEYKIDFINKYNFQYFINDKKYYNKTAVENGKKLFYENFKYRNSKYFDYIFTDVFINKLKKGDKLAIVFLRNVSFFSPAQIEEIANNPKKYNETPLLFLVFSYIKNESLQLCSESMKLDLVLDSGSWELYVFEKQ